MSLLFLLLAAVSTPQKAVNDDSFFPLSIGSEWNYRCSIEGNPSGKKRLAIIGLRQSNDGTIYTGAWQIGSSKAAQRVYFIVAKDGTVSITYDQTASTGEAILRYSMAKGERVGQWQYADDEVFQIPDNGRRSVARLETFSIDDPTISQNRRDEWRSRFFAKGIGMVGEADGLGGECTLSRYVRGR